MRQAWFVAAVTVATAVRHPRHSRPAWALALLLVAAALTGATVAPPDRIPYGVALGLVAGTACWLLLVVIGTVAVEAPRFRRASRVFEVVAPGGRALARVDEVDETWRVSSVTAWPPGQGLGDRLLTELVAAADEQRRTLELRPSAAPVARWYGRYGFVRHGRQLVRPCRPPQGSTTDTER